MVFGAACVLEKWLWVKTQCTFVGVGKATLRFGLFRRLFECSQGYQGLDQITINHHLTTVNMTHHVEARREF